MDRNMLLEHFALAQKHVVLGEQHIAHQQEVIALLEKHGHDASMARNLLHQFEALQKQHVAGRDRLKKELQSD